MYLYHGSARKFDKLSVRRSREGYFSRMVYLTDYKPTAEQYTQPYFDRYGSSRGNEPIIYHVELNDDATLFDARKNGYIGFDSSKKSKVYRGRIVENIFKILIKDDCYYTEKQQINAKSDIYSFLLDGCRFEWWRKRYGHIATKSLLCQLGYDGVIINANMYWPRLFKNEHESHYCVLNTNKLEIVAAEPLELKRVNKYV